MLFLLYAKDAEKFSNIAGKDVYIEEVEGPIDKQNLSNIINIESWNDQNIEQLIENFHRIGIGAKITIKNDAIYIKLSGPTLVLDKKSTRDSLGVGDSSDRKFAKLDSYVDLKNGYANFISKIQNFLFTYGISTERRITVEPKDHTTYKTGLTINEEQVPISFIIQDFIDLTQKEQEKIQNILFELQKNNILKSENICLKFFGKMIGDSSHFLQNLGKKDKEIIINLLHHLGYVNAKIVDKTIVNHRMPDNSIISAGLLYSIKLGKKSNLKRVVPHCAHLSLEAQNEITKTLNDKFFSSDFVFQNVKDINKILEKAKVKCNKTKIFKISDEEYEIHAWCDYNEVDKFYQNVRFNNFPCSTDTLYKIAAQYGISVGSPCIEKNLNQFNQYLEKIAGRKINFNQTQDRGVIATFTGGQKPKVFTRVETLIRTSLKEGLILSLWKLQFYFIKNRILQIHIVPEVSTNIFNGLQVLFSSIKIGGKLEVLYHTENNGIINLTTHGFFKGQEILKKFREYVAFSDLFKGDIKLSYELDDWSLNVHYDENEYHAIKNLMETENRLVEYKYKFMNFNYVLSTFIDYKHDIESNENSATVKAAINLYIPTRKNQTFGVSLTGSYHNSYSYLGNTAIFSLIGGFAPIVSPDSIFVTKFLYRIPGVPHSDSCRGLLLGRFLLTYEFWDSSQIVLKMVSLLFGPIAQIGLLNKFNNYSGYLNKRGSFKFIANAGFILMIDILGTISFFISITIDYRGMPKFDIGVIHSTNPFSQEQMMSAMA
jgi:hypothetical protein